MSAGSGIASPFLAVWKIGGIVNELRELTSTKNAAWRGYVVKLQSLGHTFELGVTAEQYASLIVGELVEAIGRFEEQAGRLKLVADRIDKRKATAT